ncbi:MAG TPA: nicotinate-nucleotide--dimethylbenzimidazole phosphoribosyltransferase [Candidatus Cybelea sp.]|nr:nicotinate-nucleotide--dimethylbenzimidazole phosphoribosyltransferase [Candidatus Cybelea sp.]
MPDTMPHSLASADQFRALLADLPRPDETAQDRARAREAVLTKPAGALGRLEEIAIWLAGWQGRHPPALNRPLTLVFAGNHGVAARGVSAFPAAVTQQMVANFEAGGAAINQLCKAFGAKLEVRAIDLDRPTADFTQGPAMSAEECLAAMTIGWQAMAPDCDVLMVGEMGIANTTAAAALAAALFGGAGVDWVGPGTGVDGSGLKRKAAAVDAALSLHGAALADPFEALRRVGGRELAAMTGAVLAARHRRVPVLLDGFVAGAAAAVLFRANADALDHCLAGHVSAEPGHARLLKILGKTPLLSLGMRLGEGSGAALALGILRGALATHTGMATFAEAGVSGKS